MGNQRHQSKHIEAAENSGLLGVSHQTLSILQAANRRSLASITQWFGPVFGGYLPGIYPEVGRVEVGR
jgi:hypothetical protein